MKELFALIRKSTVIDHKVEEEILPHLILQGFPKGKVFVSLGDITDKIYFLKSGLIREYYKLPVKHEEITSQITGKGTFFYSTEAYLKGKPSERVVETLEESELISIRKSNLEELISRFPILGVFIKNMMENTLISFEKRVALLRLRSPLQKLEEFEKLHPGLSNRIPSGVIASYLGIAPQTLSTVRSKRRKY